MTHLSRVSRVPVLLAAASLAALLLVAGAGLAQLPADDAPVVGGAPWTAWRATTPDDGDIREPTDIEFTSANQPIILYHAAQSTGIDVPHIKEWTATGWTTDRISSPVPLNGGSLTLDDQDQVHVAYERDPFTEGSSNDLKYARRTADGTFEVFQVHDVIANGINLALNDTGHPRISYQANDAAPYFAYKTADGWVTEQVDGTGGYNQDLALDSNGDPHIAYRIGGDIWYASKTDGSWSTELAKKDCAVHVSLALDNQDRPHITCDPAEGLAYVWKDAAGWHSEIVDDGSGGVFDRSGKAVGASSSLVLDGSGQPHIGYRYEPNFGAPLLAPGQPHYATKVDGDWVVEVVDRDGQHSGLGMDIALDDEERPHLTYVRDNRFEDGGGFPGSGQIDSSFDLRYARPVAAEALG